MITMPKKNILDVFRLLAITRFVISLSALFTAVTVLGEYRLSSGFGNVLFIIETFILITYLSVPQLQTILKKYYLPIAIIWSFFMPLIIRYISFTTSFNTNVTNELFALNQPLFELLFVLWVVGLNLATVAVPLIVIAWRYKRYALIWFCIFSPVFEIALLLTSLNLSLLSWIVAIYLIISRSVLFIIIGVLINWFVSIQVKQQQELERTNQELHDYAITREQLATSRERNRLARELHDTLAHTLAATTVQLEAASIIWHQQPQKAESLVVQVAQLIRDGLTETRLALQALRVNPLENLGFAESIRTLTESIMARYLIMIHLILPSHMPPLEKDTEHALYRIIQEALFNSVQHANAHIITVHIQSDDPNLFIQIHDDGSGFDVASGTIKGHFGILGMRERAESIHAKFHIESKIGGGTTITIQVKIHDHTHFNL